MQKALIFGILLILSHNVSYGMLSRLPSSWSRLRPSLMGMRSSYTPTMRRAISDAATPSLSPTPQQRDAAQELKVALQNEQSIKSAMQAASHAFRKNLTPIWRTEPFDGAHAADARQQIGDYAKLRGFYERQLSQAREAQQQAKKLLNMGKKIWPSDL